MMTRLQLARRIDHTLLKPEAGEADIRALAATALEYHFAAVCVNGCWIRLVRTILDKSQIEGSGNKAIRVAACAVVGFPFGTQETSVKAFEAAECVRAGAEEIDMVIRLPALLSGQLDAARKDIQEVVVAAKTVASDTVVKVILETAILTEPQIAMGCQAAREAGADFVKTSTGFHPAGGATAQAVRWMKAYCGNLRVKASGGIRDLATAQAMLEAGADRIGCSAGVAIVKELAK